MEPGQNAYMKGVFQPAPFPRAVIPSILNKFAELSASEHHRIVLFFEYFPLGAVNAVPDDATAYRRGLAANMLCLIFGKDSLDPDAFFQYAQKSAYELTELVTEQRPENIGYGNYSAFRLLAVFHL